MTKPTFMLPVMLALLLAGGGTAQAAGSAWSDLTPEEQETLKPFAGRWSQLPPERRERLRRNADRWRDMSPEQRQRARENMQRLRQLSPEERTRLQARQQEFGNLPPPRTGTHPRTAPMVSTIARGTKARAAREVATPGAAAARAVQGEIAQHDARAAPPVYFRPPRRGGSASLTVAASRSWFCLPLPWRIKSLCKSYGLPICD